MEKSYKTVSVFAQQANSNKTENASICQLVNQDIPGMEKLVLPYLVNQVNHMPIHVAAVKLQYLLVHQDHIGMDTDVFMSPTSAQLV